MVGETKSGTPVPEDSNKENSPHVQSKSAPVIKMGTKNRILASAIALFNQEGVHSVSIRTIAQEVGISPGNFSYHFKNKQVLIRYFYHNTYQEIHHKIDHVLQHESGLFRLNRVLEEIFAFTEKYRFFFRDIVDIFRMCPDLRQAFVQDYEQFKVYYLDMFRYFVQSGWMKKPSVPEEWNNLVHHIWTATIFAPAHKDILPEGSSFQKSDYSIVQIWSFIKPRMTEEGLLAWEKMHAVNTVAKSLSQWI
ncbi:MAG: TetR/AcrR family transcriptional regulator [Bacteroidota bacterium]